MPRRRIGIWLVGARGGVATSAILGLYALRKNLVIGTPPEVIDIHGDITNAQGVVVVPANNILIVTVDGTEFTLEPLSLVLWLLLL